MIVCCDWLAKQSRWRLFSLRLRFKIVRIYNYGGVVYCCGGVLVDGLVVRCHFIAFLKKRNDISTLPSITELWTSHTSRGFTWRKTVRAWQGMIFIIYHCIREREREMLYLTTHSTHFIYGYMASDIWLRTILIVRKETRCRHIGYSFRLAARVLFYAPSHRQHIPRPLLHQSWSTGWNEK